MLSPESSTTDFENSMKKYLVDNLQEKEKIPLFFEAQDDIPVDENGIKLEKWGYISFGGVVLDGVNSCSVLIHLFTRNDFENTLINNLMDLVTSYILDETSTNGLCSIPYYNSRTVPWTLNGGILPFIRNIFKVETLRDKTKLKTMQLNCKWGGK